MKHRAWARAGLFVGVLAATGCGGGTDRGPDRAATPVPAEDSSHATAETRQTVLCLGTSLTAGPGLLPEETWPALLQRKADSLHLPYRFVNAGVSGETSAGAIRRINWLFSQGPIAVLIVETGANDMLRGQSTDSLAANIDHILTRASQLDPRPVLVLAGMEAMPNLGERYVTRFHKVYAEAARAHGATLIPFLLDGVAGIDSLNQSDGMHPTRIGEQMVAENVWKAVKPVLTRNRVP